MNPNSASRHPSKRQRVSGRVGAVESAETRAEKGHITRSCRTSQHWGWGGANRRRRVEAGVLLMEHPWYDLILEMVLEKSTC